MPQAKLLGLATMFIEHDLTSSLDRKELIHIFTR